MADLKPIGSEKLTGQDKLNRIMEIAKFKEVAPKTINENATSEYSISLADGNNYQIVRERQGYIIKKTISESETDYIEPMKNRKYYSSYSQALKRLNLVAGELNRLNENEEGVSLYGEQKRFTLKTPKPAPAPKPMAAPPAEPPAVPSPELPPSPTDMGGEAMPMDDMGGEGMPMDDMGGEELDVDVDVDAEEGGEGMEEKITFKTIQKLTGKLTQKIRTLDNEDGMTSEDVKYVINMVLSSLDLTSLSEEDKEDIMTKFEEDETEEFGQEDDMDGEDMTDDSEVEDIQSDMDVAIEGVEIGEDYEDSRYSEDYDEDYDPNYKGEYKDESYGNGAIFDSIFGESKVDKVISKYFEMSKKEIREQELAAEKFVKENINSKFIGITNKKNLVFETKSGQVKITPNGEIL
jgi:transcriptional regulator of NAD metabolism